MLKIVCNVDLPCLNLFLEFDNSPGLDVDVVDEVHITLTDLNLCFFFRVSRRVYHRHVRCSMYGITV